MVVYNPSELLGEFRWVFDVSKYIVILPYYNGSRYYNYEVYTESVDGFNYEKVGEKRDKLLLQTENGETYLFETKGCKNMIKD